MSHSSASGADSESDEEDLAGISEEMQVEVRKNREELNCYIASHKALYGKSHSHAAKVDAWEQLIAFDATGSCILMTKDKKGNCVPVDITEGLKMANRSGHNAVDEMATVVTRCMSCNIRVTTGGDKAILRHTTEGGLYQCEKCFKNEYEEVSFGKTLSNTHYKKLAMAASGRSHMSVKKIARSALFKITKDMYGSSSSENREKMRKHFAAGLDLPALERYNMHLEKLAQDNEGCNELRCLAYSNDYVPMLTGTIGMRYGCRQRGCGLIPKYETDWFHAVQQGAGTGAKVGWYCPACGGEFTFNKEAAEGGKIDVRGQDKPYQYVIFFELPWKNEAGLSTFCAKAAAPTDLQQQQLNVLKLIAAVGGTTMKPGVTKTLLDMIVETNESFDRMVGSGFPRKTAIVKHPVHACMGEMQIAGCGILCLRETAVGTPMVFYDVTKAEEEGYFGTNPKYGKRRSTTRSSSS